MVGQRGVSCKPARTQCCRPASVVPSLTGMSTRLPQQGSLGRKEKKVQYKVKVSRGVCNNLLEQCNNMQVVTAVKKGTLTVKVMFNCYGLVRADGLI